MAHRLAGGRPGPLPVMGLLAVAATMAGLARSGYNLPPAGTAGVVLLVIAGLVPSRPRWALVARAVLGVPGGVLAGGYAFLVPCVVGPLFDDFDRRCRRRAYGPLFLAVSAFGIFATVPDTERLFVMIGATLPLALLAWPVPVVSVGTSGCLGMVGLLTAIATLDGAGRTSSIVGSLGCLALLGVEPVVRMMQGGRSPIRLVNARMARPVAAVVVTGLFALLVLFASRVAGFASVPAAVAMVVIEIVAAVVVLSLVVSRTGGASALQESGRRRGQPRTTR